MIELTERIKRYLRALNADEATRVLTTPMLPGVRVTGNLCLIFVATGCAGCKTDKPYRDAERKLPDLGDRGYRVGVDYDRLCKGRRTLEVNAAIREYLITHCGHHVPHGSRETASV